MSALAAIKQQFSALNTAQRHQRLSKQLQDHEQKLQDLRQNQQAEQARWAGLINRLQNMTADDAQWTEASSTALPQGYDDAQFNKARQNELSSLIMLRIYASDGNSRQ